MYVTHHYQIADQVVTFQCPQAGLRKSSWIGIEEFLRRHAYGYKLWMLSAPHSYTWKIIVIIHHTKSYLYIPIEESSLEEEEEKEEE